MENSEIATLHKIIEVAQDLTDHSLGVWNFYWLVCLGVLGFLFSDRAEALRSYYARGILMLGFGCFAYGNGIVLERASIRHEMSHRLLREMMAGYVRPPTSTAGQGGKTSTEAAPAKASVEVTDPSFTQLRLKAILDRTAPTAAHRIWQMHLALSVVIVLLIALIPSLKSKKPLASAEGPTALEV